MGATEDPSVTAHKAAVAHRLNELKPQGSSFAIRFFRHTQERRARAYADFDQALNAMLTGSSGRDYIVACSVTTFLFAALSADARAAITALEQLEAATAGACASKVQVQTLLLPFSLLQADSSHLSALFTQALESEKLTLTAALHLDKIKKNNLAKAAEGTDDVEAAILRVDKSLDHIREVPMPLYFIREIRQFASYRCHPLLLSLW